MFDPKRLLQYEFFPAELPPCFNSDDLATNAQHAIQTASKQNRAYQDRALCISHQAEKADCQTAEARRRGCPSRTYRGRERPLRRVRKCF